MRDVQTSKNDIFGLLRNSCCDFADMGRSVLRPYTVRKLARATGFDLEVEAVAGAESDGGKRDYGVGG